ncbi:MAG: helix-turn-helix domain-containing protein [Bacteroidota bacterium]|nr:helix-turn-helix domain-containing protein [Bacteroidota bacterium]
MDQLKIEHNEVFDLAYRFVTETSENIFLTGKAGTGKTTFLKYLKENCSKNIIVAVPTGVAAINAGGVTLHSLFQLPFTPFLPTSGSKSELLGKLKYNRQRVDLLRKMELLVIDEISMVRCDTMDAIDTILRSVRRKHELPFGGVQLLCIGDLYQLPPVAKREEMNILQQFYSSEFFFDSMVIKEQMPMLIELNKIYRQKEDSFVYLLNKVRNNQMNADDFEDLHQRYFPDFRPALEEKYITLTSHNNQADLINHRELQKLLPPSFSYEAEIEGDFPESMYPAEGTLVLKEGAQVMFLKNDVDKRYFNGKIGVIKKLQQEEILVDCDGEEIYVSQETWENSRYTLNRLDGKLEQETLGTFTQFPLRLAWAITIHKSQGLTFEKVMIDAGAAFSSGQVYVGLSRCTSLDGIVLLSKIPSAAIYSNENVIKGHQTLTPKGSLAERFEGARQIFTQQLLEDIFSFNEINAVVEVLDFRIHEQKEKLNPESLKWINDLKTSFTADRAVGLKFLSHIAAFMKDQAVIENNKPLQKRINDASLHFAPKFQTLQQSLQNHPVVTEHREAANIINEYLNQLLLALDLENYYLQYCKEPFSVTSFLQHKLKYSLPRLKVSAYASGKKQNFSDVPNPELYNFLKNWRDKVVEETRAPIYMVANQIALNEIATYLPFSKKDLMKLSGFGRAKAEKYGDDILNMVMEYCSQNNLESNMAAKEENPKRERKEKSPEEKTPSNITSFNLFKEGKTIEEIAKERNFAVTTIEGHLASFVATGEIDINKMVTPEKQILIKEAAKIHGRESYKTLKENLPEDVTYGEIRMVMAVEKMDNKE